MSEIASPRLWARDRRLEGRGIAAEYSAQHAHAVGDFQACLDIRNAYAVRERMHMAIAIFL